jgi:hypothetical protein
MGGRSESALDTLAETVANEPLWMEQVDQPFGDLDPRGAKVDASSTSVCRAAIAASDAPTRFCAAARLRACENRASRRERGPSRGLGRKNLRPWSQVSFSMVFRF